MLWVIGDGRYDTQNFTSFTISPSELVWDWSTNQSNYTTIRAQKEAALNDAAWQIESALQISPYQIQQPVLYAPNDYLPIPADDGGAGETADQVRQDDIDTLFPGANQNEVWITRMRADLSHAALANDLVVQASATQTVLSNFYQVTQSVNAPTCPPVPNPCPPCNTGSSSGGGGSTSGGGLFGSGTSSGAGGIFGASSGGLFGNGGAPGAQVGSGGGCSTAPGDDSSNGLLVAVGALLGSALLVGRNKRKR